MARKKRATSLQERVEHWKSTIEYLGPQTYTLGPEYRPHLNEMVIALQESFPQYDFEIETGELWQRMRVYEKF